jgi:hypothetical protein
VTPPHEKVTQALLEALRLALAAGAEQRLYRSGKLDGLFPSRAGAAGEAAQQALRANLLEVVRTEARGKVELDWVRLTPAGVDYLHEHESPVAALHELRAALRANQQAVPLWLGEMHGTLREVGERLSGDAGRWERRLSALERRVDEALRRLEAASPLLAPEVAEAHPWAVDALNYLDRRRAGGAADDCPLPELFAAVARHHPGLSVPAFHEGLRKLHERRALLLRPADDPAELTQAEYALRIGANVLYYARR